MDEGVAETPVYAGSHRGSSRQDREQGVGRMVKSAASTCCSSRTPHELCVRRLCRSGPAILESEELMLCPRTPDPVSRWLHEDGSLTGERLSIGRSSAAELCFPEDAGLSACTSPSSPRRRVDGRRPREQERAPLFKPTFRSKPGSFSSPATASRPAISSSSMLPTHGPRLRRWYFSRRRERFPHHLHPGHQPSKARSRTRPWPSNARAKKPPRPFRR